MQVFKKMHEIKWRLHLVTCSLMMLELFFFPASASLQHYEVTVSVSGFSSFSVLTCVLLLLPLRARRMDESLQRKSHLNLLLQYVSVFQLFASLAQCMLSPFLLVVSYSPLKAGSFFLSDCLWACQGSSCSTNYLSPCLLTCLSACQWIHMLLLMLSQQLDSQHCLHTYILTCHSST